MQKRNPRISKINGVLEIKTCDACGHYYEELVMARLVLVSGQVVYRYLCEHCLSYIENKRRE